MIAGLAAGFLHWRSQQRWLQNDFPNVAVTLPISGGDPGWTLAQAEAKRRALAAALGDYAGIRVVAGKPDSARFEISITFIAATGTSGPNEFFQAIDTNDGRVIWTRVLAAPSPEAANRNALDVAYALANPSGAIPQYVRRQGYTPESPFGCWLRFTESVQILRTTDDSAFASCAQRWYAAAPKRSMAAFLYSWSLLDRATRAAGSTERREAIDQALAVIHRAMASDPDYALLYVAEVRGYSLAGNREMVGRSGRDALSMARDNRLIAGLAASELILWNDPAGVRALDSLAAYPGYAPPWESIGRFIEAAMRDDVDAAADAAPSIARIAAGQPRLNLLLAALKARQGDQAASRAILRDMRADPRLPPIHREGAGALSGVAPEVAGRLRAWLAHDTAPSPASAPARTEFRRQ